MAQSKIAYLLSDMPVAVRLALLEHLKRAPEPARPRRELILGTLKKWSSQKSDMKILAAARSQDPRAVWARLLMSQVEFESRSAEEKASRPPESFTQCEAHVIRTVAARTIEKMPMFYKPISAATDAVLIAQLKIAFDEATRAQPKGPYAEVRRWLDSLPRQKGGPWVFPAGKGGRLQGQLSFSAFAKYVCSRVDLELAQVTINELKRMMGR